MEDILKNEEYMKENNDNSDSGSDSNPSEDELNAKELNSIVTNVNNKKNINNIKIKKKVN